MIIAGAGGHAREVLDILVQLEAYDSICFYEELRSINSESLLGYQIIRKPKLVSEIFKHAPDFTLGIGKPLLRKSFAESLQAIGGKMCSLIAPDSIISSSAFLENGVNIMYKVLVSSSTIVGEGALINAGTNIHHDVEIGKYTEVGPMSTITGECKIGDFCSLGAAVTVIPNVKIGDSVVVAAGSTVIANVPSNCMIAGCPAKIKKFF